MVTLSIKNRYRTNLSQRLAFMLFCLCVKANASPESMPQVSEMAVVQHCQFLDKVEGNSGYGKNANWQALAKHSALGQAEKLGASHVVWEEFVPVGSFNGIAIAKAFLCK